MSGTVAAEVIAHRAEPLAVSRITELAAEATEHRAAHKAEHTGHRCLFSLNPWTEKDSAEPSTLVSVLETVDVDLFHPDDRLHDENSAIFCSIVIALHRFSSRDNVATSACVALTKAQPAANACSAYHREAVSAQTGR